jgi:hypothetical protein
MLAGLGNTARVVVNIVCLTGFEVNDFQHGFKKMATFG